MVFVVFFVPYIKLTYMALNIEVIGIAKELFNQYTRTTGHGYIVLLLDFTAAFDTIIYILLLNRLLLTVALLVKCSLGWSLTLKREHSVR